MQTSGSSSEPLKTPLYEAHRSLGALMAPFSGWFMPIQYTGIIAEHMHTRQKVSIFDTCHMGEFLISGPKAARDIDLIVTSDVTNLKLGQCRYGFILNEKGFILDDTIVYRLSNSSFMMVVNAGTKDGDAEWIKSHISSSTVFSDDSYKTAKLDLQGPSSKELIKDICTMDLESLKYFRFTKGNVFGTDMIISRTGYTGEYGYEFYFDSAAAHNIWGEFLKHTDIEPAGLGARDTLRLEVGYPLYGQDLDSTVNPADANAMQFVNMNKDFIGKSSLESYSPIYTLAPFAAEGRRSPRHGDKIFCNSRNVGHVTSGSFSPSLKKGIGLGYIKNSFIQEGTSLTIKGERGDFPAAVTKLPFYKEGSVKKL